MNPNTLKKIQRLLNGESFRTKEPGNSMLPLYKSNEEHLLTPITWNKCKVGDVVFCKVRGSCITHKVYAIDSRCHGKSENTEKISYDLMAKDVIEFIKQKEIESPILYGFSDGGIIGLKIAIEEPNLLSKLIVSGANINPKGMKNMTLFWCKFAYWISKDKLIKMMIDEPNILPSELAKIKIPVHVIAGQKDVIKQKHTMLIANSIKNSTLDIIPNENHGSYIVDSEKIYYIIKKYI